MSLKHLLGGLAVLAAMTLPAKAVLLGNDIQDWNLAGALTLQLTNAVPSGQQTTNQPCVICGAHQPQQPNLLGYNWFGNQGNDSSISFFSTAAVPQGPGGLAQDTLGTGYSLIDGSPLLSAIGGRIEFSIGIDMNQSNTAQTLESFWFLNLTQQTVLAVFSPGPGGVALPTIQNGTGFPDYTLSGLTLAGINPGDDVMFYARITGANDGPDSFFLIPQVQAVPLGPAGWYFGAGLFGLLALQRRRKRKLLEQQGAVAA